MARNRIIYQSQALFIAPSATGTQISGLTNSGIASVSPFAATGAGGLTSGISLLKKLDRIQSCNFNFTVNRQDINEFGKSGGKGNPFPKRGDAEIDVDNIAVPKLK